FEFRKIHPLDEPARGFRGPDGLVHANQARRQCNVRASMAAAAPPAKVVVAALAMLAAAVATDGAQAQNVSSLADRDGIFIDGRNVEILRGKSRGDVRRLVDALGAREIGPGAIIFRAGDRIYIVDALAGLPAGAVVGPQRGQVLIAYEPPKNPEHQKVYQAI